MATAAPPFALTSDGPANPGWATMHPQQFPVSEIKAMDVATSAAPSDEGTVSYDPAGEE